MEGARGEHGDATRTFFRPCDVNYVFDGHRHRWRAHEAHDTTPIARDERRLKNRTTTTTTTTAMTTAATTTIVGGFGGKRARPQITATAVAAAAAAVAAARTGPQSISVKNVVRYFDNFHTAKREREEKLRYAARRSAKASLLPINLNNA